MKPNVGIIGVGLIGGSFGMALKKRGLSDKIIGIGRSPERLQKAVELGAIDTWTIDVAQGVRDADLVYVSTPVGMELELIQKTAQFAKPDCIITDAGSTKAHICKGADSIGVTFVGGHPMAGSDAAGVDAAESDLFVNAAYVLTPTNATNTGALAIMKNLAESIGSRVVILDPETHDRCTAIISHLPHLMAAALVSLAQKQSASDSQILELIAGSFRDMTRVAGSPPNLWRDICLTNVEGIREAAEGFSHVLAEGLAAIESGDADALENWFSKAKQIRDELFQC